VNGFDFDNSTVRFELYRIYSVQKLYKKIITSECEREREN